MRQREWRNQAISGIYHWTHTRIIPKSHRLHAESVHQDETGKQASSASQASTCAQCSVEILSSLSGVVMNLLAAILEVCSSLASAVSCWWNLSKCSYDSAVAQDSRWTHMLIFSAGCSFCLFVCLFSFLSPWRKKTTPQTEKWQICLFVCFFVLTASGEPL